MFLRKRSSKAGAQGEQELSVLFMRIKWDVWKMCGITWGREWTTCEGGSGPAEVGVGL